MLPHKFDPLGDRRQEQRQKIVPELTVDLCHDAAGGIGFGGGLPSLGILGEDLRPVRSEEDLAVVAEETRCLEHVKRNGDAGQAEISDHVLDAAIEEDRAGDPLHLPIGAHLPAQHELEEGERAGPGQGSASDGDLILDDGATGLGDGRAAAEPCHRVNERSLSGTRASRDDDESIHQS